MKLALLLLTLVFLSGCGPSSESEPATPTAEPAPGSTPTPAVSTAALNRDLMQALSFGDSAKVVALLEQGAKAGKDHARTMAMQIFNPTEEQKQMIERLSL